MKYLKLFETFENGYTVYTGVSLTKWETIWKDKNLTDRITNVTADISFAFDYSYDFETGKYDNVIVEISNIPIEAFVAYREDEYSDDDDFHSMNRMDINEKKNCLDSYSLFLVSLFKYKDIITTKLIKK